MPLINVYIVNLFVYVMHMHVAFGYTMKPLILDTLKSGHLVLPQIHTNVYDQPLK